jgi:hypothetical protein
MEEDVSVLIGANFTILIIRLHDEVTPTAAAASIAAAASTGAKTSASK